MFLRLRLGDALHGAGREHDVLFDGEVRKQVVALEHDADVLAAAPADRASGRSTRWPHTTISPLSIVSRRSMQRSAVLLPEPLRPMMAITSPRSTSKLDAVEHLERAEALVHVARATTTGAECVM